MVTHLETDILECEVKWALGSITTNKASRGDGIPTELFQILKDYAIKVLHSICQQVWKTQQWPLNWERSVFIPIPKKDDAKEYSNCHRVVLISHTLKVMLKILQARLQQLCDLRNSRCTSWVLKRQRNQRSNCQHLLYHAESQGIQKNIYSASLTRWKPLTIWITTNCGKFLRDESTRPPYLTLKKPVCRSKSSS